MYWIIGINLLTNTLDLQDRVTGNIIYYKSISPVSKYRIRQIYTFNKEN